MLEYAIPMPYHPIQIRMWGQDIDHNLLQQLGTRDTSPAIRLQVQSCQSDGQDSVKHREFLVLSVQNGIQIDAFDSPPAVPCPGVEGAVVSGLFHRVEDVAVLDAVPAPAAVADVDSCARHVVNGDMTYGNGHGHRDLHRCERYGDRLAGWMFDDELVYYPAPYERLGKAAKAGSKARIISYNAWIQGRGTDFQDVQFGEGFTGSQYLSVSARGIWPAGPMKGLHAHGNFQIDGPDWGINRPDTVIQPPPFTSEKAIQIALDAAQRDIALSWNMLMYDDGSVSDASLKQMQGAGHAVRKQYPRTKL